MITDDQIKDEKLQYEKQIKTIEALKTFKSDNEKLTRFQRVH